MPHLLWRIGQIGKKMGSEMLVGNDSETLLDAAHKSLYLIDNKYFINHLPMQKVEKIKFRMSSEVVWPVSESSAHSAR